MIAALFVTALAGVAIGAPALRLADLYLALTTVAFAYIIATGANDWIFFTGGPGGVGGLQLQLSSHSWVRWLGNEYLWFVAGVFFAFWLLLRRIVRSRWGRALVGIRDSQSMAAAVGVRVDRLKLGAFVTSAACTGVAGALFAHLGYLSPDIFQLSLSIAFVTILFLGGAGTLYGSILGALFVVGFPEVVTINANLNLALYGVMLIAVMIIAPTGLSGIPAMAVGAVRDRLKPSADVLRESPESDKTTLQQVLPTPTGNDPSEARVLCATNIHKTFGGLRVLEGVEIEVSQGELVGLIGPNGSGKTTFLNILGGQLRADAGTVILYGRDATRFGVPRRAELGLSRTFQHGTLCPSLTVTENVMLGAHRRGEIPYAAAAWLVRRRLAEETMLRDQAESLLDEVGIADEYRDRRPEKLPYGILRLVEVAVALATNPKVLLLDEPAAGLIEEEIHRLAVVLRHCLSRDIGIVLVEHHISLVLNLAHRVLVLESGQIIASGEPHRVAREPKVLEAYLGPAWGQPAVEAR
jgi:branched-chain amino acid transport system permease protein